MLNVNIGENVDRMIENDPNRIRQILLNLLSNALKFTVKGSITITVKFQEIVLLVDESKKINLPRDRLQNRGSEDVASRNKPTLIMHNMNEN